MPRTLTWCIRSKRFIGVVERAGQRDRRGVVDQDVDAAERVDRLRHRGLDLRLVAHVHRDRQRLAARALDLLGRRVDRPRQLRMRLDGLGGDDDVGAVARGAQRDGLADAAAGAGDEEGLAGEATCGQCIGGSDGDSTDRDQESKRPGTVRRPRRS